MVTNRPLENGYGSRMFRSLVLQAFAAMLIAGCATSSAEYPDRPMAAPAPVMEPPPEPVPAAAPVADVRETNPVQTIAAPAPAQVKSFILPADGVLLTQVYYATDRTRSGRTFSAKPADPAASLSYGSVVVSLPTKRVLGTVPLMPWYDESTSNKERKYVLLHPLRAMTAAQFFSNVSGATFSTPAKAAFIYIHGYNNSFDDAARRTGQIAVDLNLPVVPVMYSWPSTAKITGYGRDLKNANASITHLEAFFRDFAERSDAKQIFVIAHSMGNLVTTNALKSLFANRSDLSTKFTQVVLAAPDIDPDVFRKEIAPRFSELKMPVTIYSSRHDRALKASVAYHTRLRMTRLRLGHPDAIVGKIDGVDFVDASVLRTNFMGHDYVASNRAMLTDMAQMFKSGTRAKDRVGLFGEPMPVPERWRFP